MVSVWLCRDGLSPTSGSPIAVLPLAECEKRLGLERRHYLQDLSQTPRFGKQDDDLAIIRGYQHVVVEVDELEAKQLNWRAGFYLLPVTPAEAYHRLGIATGDE